MNWIFWLVLVIILSVIEIATVNLLTVWFVISGLVAMILSFFIDDVAVVSTVFAILGIILLILSRPIVKKIRSNKSDKTNLDRIIGSTAIVTEEIKRNVVGEVKVDGKRWSATASKKINVGEEVRVKAIEGVKLVVEKEE